MKRHLLTLIIAIAASASNQAVSVAFFENGSYNDTSGEAPNMRNSILGLGHTVTTFSGITQTAFATALGGSDVLVIPEQERGSLYSALSSAARAEITSFVQGGGNLVVAGDGSGYAVQLLNGLFGYSLTQAAFVAGGSTTLDLVEAAGSPWAAGPAILPNSNGTALLNRGSLPASALDIYHDAARTTVFNVLEGSGSVTFLGYDWFEGQGPAEWNSVLNSSLIASAPVSTPELSSTLGLLTMSFAGLAIARRRKS